MRKSLAFALLSILVCAGNTKPNARRLSAEDVFNLELATGPQISPDGRRIVYVRQFADISADKRRSNLWIINSDGSDHRPLTTGNFSDAAPRWSSDGTQIAYSARPLDDEGPSPSCPSPSGLGSATPP